MTQEQLDLLHARVDELLPSNTGTVNALSMRTALHEAIDALAGIGADGGYAKLTDDGNLVFTRNGHTFEFRTDGKLYLNGVEFTTGGTGYTQATLEAASSVLNFLNPLGHIRNEALTGAQTFTRENDTAGSYVVQRYLSDGLGGITLPFAFYPANFTNGFTSGDALPAGEYNLIFANMAGTVSFSASKIGGTQGGGAVTLNAPGSFTASSVGNDVVLSWTDTNSSPQEVNTVLEVSDNGTNWATLATLAPDVTGYTHTGQTAGIAKHYRAKTKGDGTTSLDSAYTPTVSATPGEANYSSLTNPELILDYTGLQAGQSNAYGEVGTDNYLINMKSIAPAPVRTFTPVGTGAALFADGVNLSGAQELVNTDKTAWRFLHGSPTGDAAVKFTIHYVVKMGVSDNPNALMGMLGTNAASTANVGFSMGYDDRSGSSKNNAFVAFMTKGASGVSNLIAGNNTVFTPNTFVVLTVEVDLSDATKGKVYINNVDTGVTFTYTAGTVDVDATYSLAIGSLGNGVGKMNARFKQVIMQKAIETQTKREAFVNWLIGRIGT